MPPSGWTTTEEFKWLDGQLPAYLEAQVSAKLYSFWPKVTEAWFKKFPEEARLQFDLTPDPDGNAPVLSPEQKSELGVALERRKGQILAWFRNHSRNTKDVGATRRKADDSLLAALFQKKKQRQRAHYPIEIFQKLHAAEIDAALLNAGFGDLNEEKMSQDVDDWVNESDKEHLERVKSAQSKRMTLRNRTVNQLFGEISEEERADIDAVVAKEKAVLETKKTQKDKGKQEEPEPEEDRTLSQYQSAIDESNEVFARVHKIIGEQTGWHGFTVYGGPNPRYGGALSMKVVCFGKSSTGNDFEAAHGSFNNGISKPFQAFLKRCFSSEDRRARALVEPEAEPDVPDLEEQFRVTDEQAAPPIAERPKPKRMSKSKSKSKTQAAASNPGGAANPSAAAPQDTAGDLSSAPSQDMTGASASDESAVDATGAPPKSPVSASSDHEDPAVAQSGGWGFGDDTDYTFPPDMEVFGPTDNEDSGSEDTGRTMKVSPPGMSPPTSPRSAAANALLERGANIAALLQAGGGFGGPTYTPGYVPDTPIDPSLLRSPSPSTPVRPTHAAHAMSFNHPAQRSTLFRTPQSSPSCIQELFSDFRDHVASSPMRGSSFLGAPVASPFAPRAPAAPAPRAPAPPVWFAAHAPAALAPRAPAAPAARAPAPPVWFAGRVPAAPAVRPPAAPAARTPAAPAPRAPAAPAPAPRVPAAPAPAPRVPAAPAPAPRVPATPAPAPRVPAAPAARAPAAPDQPRGGRESEGGEDLGDEAAASQIRSRPMANAPVAPKPKKAPPQPKKAAPTATAAAKRKEAAKVAAKVEQKRPVGRPKGSGAKGRGAGAALSDTTNKSDGAATPLPTPMFSMPGNNTMAFNRQRDAEAAARKAAVLAENARIFNPDGETPLIIVPPPSTDEGGPRRRKPTEKVLAMEREQLAKKGAKQPTRAEQAAKKNEASEKALLARAGQKRGAAEDAEDERPKKRKTATATVKKGTAAEKAAAAAEKKSVAINAGGRGKKSKN